MHPQLMRMMTTERMKDLITAGERARKRRQARRAVAARWQARAARPTPGSYPQSPGQHEEIQAPEEALARTGPAAIPASPPVTRQRG
jgi:hypothetical protein